MANHLANETSPYLRQHAENPVAWYPWGEEALGLARAQDRPILLSIGYAACHWCHVMAHESFEDEATARVMNAHFVNIKVDREERPDLDSIYMQAVQSMTGHGGWPMTVFLTPEGEPFYAGTYFPPDDRPGMPSFRRVLESVADAYRAKKDRVARTAAAVREIYAASTAPTVATGKLALENFDHAYKLLAHAYDTRFGGFQSAPKFPQAMCLDFLLRYWTRTGTDDALAMALQSFLSMARGGIYDQIGGGFHRYSVDAEWLVPHFEKMLYDNALLAKLGVHLWQATQDEEVRRVTEETIDWVLREMTAPNGAFYSTLDADSEGHEGRFYVWKESEIDAVLGPESARVKPYYGVTPEGNFEGENILFVADSSAMPPGLARAKTRLCAARDKRVRPNRDEKVLAGWNGLMARSIAMAARAFDHGEYREAAIFAGRFLADVMVSDDGRVMRTHAAGVTKTPGFLEDHAAVGLAFIALYELTNDVEWLDRAHLIADVIDTWFWDETAQAYFDTARDAETLITRPRDVTDNAVPAGTSLTVDLIMSLHLLRPNATRRARALWVLETLAEPMTRHPLAFGYLLSVADMAVHGTAAGFVCHDGVCEIPTTVAI